MFASDLLVAPKSTNIRLPNTEDGLLGLIADSECLGLASPPAALSAERDGMAFEKRLPIMLRESSG